MASSSGPTRDTPPPESTDHVAHPTNIGNYRILETLGEGGFGIVYLAEQTSPVRRRVAIKLIKPGMDTRAVIARFEAERQALAVMDHPGIAKVFDAGATDRGLPYFVMEHVRGIPITAFADQQRLSIPQRLNLMTRVCHAVQHAHAKGVIHRDLKPSNILVTDDPESGHAPSPKIIDFGVAKALNTRLSDNTVYTRHGQLIGTPEYMSPEQAEMSGLDVDTRADVYSLGVILYELLTGALPFDASDLRSPNVPDIQRTIREVQPPKPSTRLSTHHHTAHHHPHTTTLEHATEIAQRRRTSLASLRRLLSRDLDWVVMKCLEKDRARRYDTAAALADDLQRFLRSEPVSAGPPSPLYRLGKLTRRHRLPIAAAFLLLLVLAAATVVSTSFALRERAARNETAEQARLARATLDFLTDDVLAHAAPSRLTPNAPARDILAAASDALLDKSAHDPALTTTLNHELAQILLRCDDARRADEHARRALEWRSANLPPSDPHLHDALSDAATIATELGRLDEAERLYTRLAAVLDDERSIAQTQHNLAIVKRRLGKTDDADALSAKALETRERLLGPAHPDTLTTMSSRAQLLRETNRLDEAETLARRALEGRASTLGPDHPHAINAASVLARILAQRNRHDDALAIFNDIIPTAQSRFGEASVVVAILRRERARSLIALERHDDAQSDLLLAFDNAAAALGQSNPRLLDFIEPIITLYEQWPRPDQAEPWRRRAATLTPTTTTDTDD